MRLLLPTIALLAPMVPGLRAMADVVTDRTPAPIIRSWGTEAGLPQNTITAITQTPDGYLWLGTRDGLARFDGLRFRTFGLEDGLPNVDITSLLVDHLGVLWVGTASSGLCRMWEGRVEAMIDESRRPGSDTITCLQEDAAGRLWVGTRGGLRFCRGGRLVEDPSLHELAETPIVCLERSQDGTTIWIGSPRLTLQVFENGHLEPCICPPAYERISAESLLADRQGRLWVGIGNGTVLCRETNAWRVLTESNGLPFAFITCMAQDSQGTVWAGSLDDGLYRFNGSRFIVVRQADGLSAEDISSLYCDHRGELWVGTRTGGLDLLGQRKVMVVGRTQGLTNDYTRSVAETADGTLWVGTVGGSLYRGGISGFQPFRPEDRVYFYATVYPVLALPGGGIWWGGSGALLHWQDERLADCITNEPWLGNTLVTALQEDRHGGLWVGTGAGRLVHLQKGRFTEFPQQITRATITSIAVQPDGGLWVGTTANGLNLVREGDPNILAITNGLSAKSSVRTLYLDDDGVLWIGTAGGGLCCWRKGVVASFSAAQRVTQRTVSQIVEDAQGFLWLGCSHGILRISKRDLLDCADGKIPFVHCRSFGLSDGMVAEECSGGFCPAGLRTRSGLICISTVKGLVFINPQELGEEPPPAKALIEEVRVNGRLRQLDEGVGTPSTPQLTLPSNAHDIEVQYTAPELLAPEKLAFRYRLEGLQDGWTEAGARRTAYYSHLAPRDYIFHVQACTAEGNWNQAEARLAITVLPFFWETAWFRAAAVLSLSGAFAAGLWLVLRRRYRLRLARLQMLNAVEHERLRISKDMHDQVGSVLTQVSQLSDMGLNETGDKALVKNRFERIGDRARVAVQSLDEIVWATNPKNDNLASFAEYVSRFADEFFEYTTVHCWQEMPAKLPVQPLPAEVRHNVFLAVREAMSNVLRHSKCTELWLRMRIAKGEIVLEVEDNGAGFDLVSRAPGGNGLDNMQARLAECGGEASLHSAPGKGTRVCFTFPVHPRNGAEF